MCVQQTYFYQLYTSVNSIKAEVNIFLWKILTIPKQWYKNDTNFSFFEVHNCGKSSLSDAHNSYELKNSAFCVSLDPGVAVNSNSPSHYLLGNSNSSSRYLLGNNDSPKEKYTLPLITQKIHLLSNVRWQNNRYFISKTTNK